MRARRVVRLVFPPEMKSTIVPSFEKSACCNGASEKVKATSRRDTIEYYCSIRYYYNIMST